MTSLNAIAATERRADLHRRAGQWRVGATVRPARSARRAQPPTVALRLAHPGEAAIVHNLAALDDAPAPEGQILLAFIDGEPSAALSLSDGHLVANPFVPTEEAVSLLRLRAKHLSGGKRRRRWRPVFRPRFA